jgi:hypothetical protein
MRRLFPLVLVLIAFVACHKESQPVDSATHGNATDRTTNGTTGTGEPASPANDTAAAATQLGTASATDTMAATGTEVVHGQQTVTTSTMKGPAGTATAAVETPTETTSTIKATTSTQQKKH